MSLFKLSRINKEFDLQTLNGFVEWSDERESRILSKIKQLKTSIVAALFLERPMPCGSGTKLNSDSLRKSPCQ
jgi:hypothetical protein